MEQERLKIIVKHLELLVESLKSEIYSDTSSYLDTCEDEEIPAMEYDEVFDDDGYPD